MTSDAPGGAADTAARGRPVPAVRGPEPPGAGPGVAEARRAPRLEVACAGA